MPQVAPFFIIKSQVVPFFIVAWPPNVFSSDTFKGISGPDSDSKLAPNIIDKYSRFQARGSSSQTPSPVVLTYLLLLSGYTACQVFFAIQHFC